MASPCNGVSLSLVKEGISAHATTQMNLEELYQAMSELWLVAFCFLTFSIFIYLCIVCGSQGTTCRSWLSSPTMWVPGITLRSSGGKHLSPLSPLIGPQSDCGFCRRCVALPCPCPEQNYGCQTMFHSSRKLFSSKTGDRVL